MKTNGGKKTVKKPAKENDKIIAEATMTFDRSKYDVTFGAQSF
jgi:hypothetical protein